MHYLQKDIAILITGPNQYQYTRPHWGRIVLWPNVTIDKPKQDSPFNTIRGLLDSCSCSRQVPQQGSTKPSPSSGHHQQKHAAMYRWPWYHRMMVVACKYRLLMVRLTHCVGAQPPSASSRFNVELLLFKSLIGARWDTHIFSAHSSNDNELRLALCIRMSWPQSIPHSR